MCVTQIGADTRVPKQALKTPQLSNVANGT
jgi:hypothetical protein